MDLSSYTSLFDLTNRHAVVIGAGSGIGEAVAYGLAAFGAELTCADLDLESAEAVATSIRQQGGRAVSARVNLSEQASVRQLFGSLTAAPDVLVCTPSVNVRKPLLELTPEEFDKVVNLNLRGSFFAMQEAGKAMRKHERGSIILFSSIRSQVVEPGQGVYAATKAGTLQMVRALAAELGPSGVRVNAVAPGVVETPLTEPIKANAAWYRAYAEKSALERWAQPQEMVGPVLYLASEAASFVTGSLVVVDGGWTAIDGRFTPPLG